MNNYQYGQPIFGSHGQRTSANSSLRYQDSTIEDVLAANNPHSHTPNEPNNDRITSRQAMMFGSLSRTQQMIAVYLGLTSNDEALFYDPGAPDCALPLTYPLEELTHLVGVIGVASPCKPYRGLDSYQFTAAQLPTVETWESDLLKVPVAAFDRGGLVRFPLPAQVANGSLH